MKVKERNKIIIQMVIAIIGVVGGLLGVNAFYQYVLMSLPLVVRMVLMIVTYLPIALVPFCIVIFNKEKWSDYGFSKDLIGKSDWVNNQHIYNYAWQYIYDFIQCIGAVALVEEFVFRGFFYKKLETLFGSAVGAIIGSSILFGLFHFLGGNIGQIILTGFIGAIFCICRVKIKNCTLLSVIIAHGVYDALITVWLNVFT
mgnify:CR=1 FL=1